MEPLPFGHYIPFLEISFGINVLFSAWDGWFGAYLRRSNPLEGGKLESRVAALDQQDQGDFSKALKRYKRIHEWCYLLPAKISRSLGVLIAVSIAGALFYVLKTDPVSLTCVHLIRASALLLPTLAGALWVIERLLVWRIRKKEKELAGLEKTAQLEQKLAESENRRETAERLLKEILSAPEET